MTESKNQGRLTIPLPTEHLNILKEEAEKKDQSKAALVRVIIKEWIEKQV